MGNVGIDMSLENILFSFGLTLLAGLSTGIGGLITVFSKRTNTKFLSVILGFSAGVMIYISFMEMLPEANLILTQNLGQHRGLWSALAAFFGGVIFIAIIDNVIPSESNPHESHKVEEIEETGRNVCGINNSTSNEKLLRTGLFTALVIAIHNFPEGLAAFTSAFSQASLGIVIAVAIAIHNIPEGMAVSIPIYCVTGSKKKAFLYALFSGLAEPLGAILGFFILSSFLNDIVLGILFAVVAGIMVYISFDELLPSAEEYGQHHLAILGLRGGMALMAVSLILFA